MENFLYEKAFSDGYNYALEVLFSENKKEKSDKKRRIHLDDDAVNSYRGIGRAALLGGPYGLVGGYAGKKYANRLDREGKTDDEIKRGATKRGAIVGAGTGAALGGLTGLGIGMLANKNLKDLGISGMFKKSLAATALGRAAVAGGFGALGGALGAKKNTEERIRNRQALRSRLQDLEDKD